MPRDPGSRSDLRDGGASKISVAPPQGAPIHTMMSITPPRKSITSFLPNPGKILVMSAIGLWRMLTRGYSGVRQPEKKPADAPAPRDNKGP